MGMGGLTALGYFLDKAGEGANDTANASLKLAVVAAFGIWLWKSKKVR